LNRLYFHYSITVSRSSPHASNCCDKSIQ
jgi:hypothetical protein